MRDSCRPRRRAVVMTMLTWREPAAREAVIRAGMLAGEPGPGLSRAGRTAS